MKKQEQASLVHDLGFGKGQAKSDMIYLLALVDKRYMSEAAGAQRKHYSADFLSSGI